MQVQHHWGEQGGRPISKTGGELPEGAHVVSLRLTRFKTFRNAQLPFGELTLLIGRNGSGKSNAIDGLVALSRLSTGEDLREALEGPRLDSEPIRGGAEGCAPFGRKSFQIGCRVRHDRSLYDFEISIQVSPELRVLSEKLTVVEGVRYGNRYIDGRELLSTERAESGRMDLIARCFNGKRGVNPPTYFSATRMLITQVPGRLRTDTDAYRLVHSAAASVRDALAAIFVLDPIPHLMRQYVNSRDNELRRNADNLSAAIALLEDEDPDAFHQLEDTLRAMPEWPLREIVLAESTLDDVLVAIKEEPIGNAKRPSIVPARLMSDGMLRFLAFGTALLSAPLVDGKPDRRPRSDDAAYGQRMIVFEEVENGLHPTMAARVIGLVKSESQRRRIRTLVTSHSPALLNALASDDHSGVIVCDRDPDTGLSRLQPLTELPGYPELMAQGSLGDTVSRGELAQAVLARPRISEAFAEFLGEL